MFSTSAKFVSRQLCTLNPIVTDGQAKAPKDLVLSCVHVYEVSKPGVPRGSSALSAWSSHQAVLLSLPQLVMTSPLPGFPDI